MRAPKGAKKQFPICHLCGREFGTASLKIHLKACAEKYEREKGKPAPSAPDMLGQLTAGDRPISSADWEAYNEAAQSAAQGEMEPCPQCGRTFSGKDRLAVHLRSCKGPAAPKVSSRDRGVVAPPTTREQPAAVAARAPPPVRGSAPVAAAAPPAILPPPTAALAAAGTGAKSAKERMQELKELLDACLISQDEFDGKRQEILDSL